MARSKGFETKGLDQTRRSHAYVFSRSIALLVARTHTEGVCTFIDQAWANGI